MGALLSAAVRGAVAPADVPLAYREPGRYVSAVALRAGQRPDEVAARVPSGLGRAERGMIVIEVPPESVTRGILREGVRYGIVERVPGGGWPERPRTFANPGFAVRYAYARAGWAEAADGRVTGNFDAAERRLAGALPELPGRAAQAVREADATPLIAYLERLACVYHDVHERPGPIRGVLARAARIALGNGLTMIGETPRERI